jgi:hypothetical protein
MTLGACFGWTMAQTSLGAYKAWQTRRANDTAVEYNLPPEYGVVWQRLKRQFRGTVERRTELFLEWAENHGHEINAILQEHADRMLEAGIRAGAWLEDPHDVEDDAAEPAEDEPWSADFDPEQLDPPDPDLALLCENMVAEPIRAYHSDAKGPLEEAHDGRHDADAGVDGGSDGRQPCLREGLPLLLRRHSRRSQLRPIREAAPPADHRGRRPVPRMPRGGGARPRPGVAERIRAYQWERKGPLARGPPASSCSCPPGHDCRGEQNVSGRTREPPRDSGELAPRGNENGSGRTMSRSRDP